MLAALAAWAAMPCRRVLPQSHTSLRMDSHSREEKRRAEERRAQERGQ
jgi:hypothetical protein